MNTKAETLALNLFLSLSLQQVLKGMQGPDRTAEMEAWVAEQVAASAACLFGNTIEA